MSNASSIFTKRKMGLDRNVWWVMFVCCVLAIGLASYKLAGEKPCVNVIVAINGTTQGLNKTFFIGETVRFSALFAEGKKIKWDFGDKSNNEQGLRSTHTFKSEGKFPITITIDGNCIQHDMVVIKKFISDTSAANNEAIRTLFGNPIDGNVSPTVMQSVIYSSTAVAKSYEWSVSNFSNYQVKNTRDAQFVFQTPGLKVLQLMLDGDPSKVYKKDIIVQPLPVLQNRTQDMPPPQVPVYIPQPINQAKDNGTTAVEKPADKPVDKPAEIKPFEVKPDLPAKPKTIRIGNENFKDMLQDVVENNLDVADFNDYLCDQGKTRVLINDEKNWTTFSSLCQKIRGDKRVTITEVEQTIENNCVVKIKVQYDRKKKFLGIGGN
ncbi:hypothetical protein BH10BAC3_BH10BAC3_36390 [soil metagenome]